VAKHGRATVTVCSKSFLGLGTGQAKAFGFPDLPIAVIPHPFGSRKRDEIVAIAEQCADDIAQLVIATGQAADAATGAGVESAAALLQVSADADEFNSDFMSRLWGDGLPLIAPTPARVERMLAKVRTNRNEVVACLAPGFGNATVELIAINAVMAGCRPDYLPVLIAATQAVAAPEFNLQALQSTTNPVAVWLIVNGPVAQQLGVNSGMNCLGEGFWANATLGRALRLILRNIGGARPGDLDRATQGQPGKFTFCCAENEAENPWEPLHVERGFKRGQSTVTVVGAEGTMNMNEHTKDAAEFVRVVGETMIHPSSNEYCHGAEPWLMLSPEHAEVLKRAGMSKLDVKRALWESSKMVAGRMSGRGLMRTQSSRKARYGEITPQTVLAIAHQPEDMAILVAGGPGTQSVYIPSFGNTRSVTREVILADG